MSLALRKFGIVGSELFGLRLVCDPCCLRMCVFKLAFVLELAFKYCLSFWIWAPVRAPIVNLLSSRDPRLHVQQLFKQVQHAVSLGQRQKLPLGVFELPQSRAERFS